MVAIREHFRSEGQGRESEWARQRKWFIKARHDHQRREEIADKHEDGVAALAAETVMATQAQIERFEVKLDSYDQATVAALMENQELLDAVQDRISDMLAQAYVMEDGRRVFGTEDGTQVFDEFGVEVGADELDPLLVGDQHPTWEAYAAERASEQALIAERGEILEFQERLDAAREQVAEGDITVSDLEELDAELLDIMPDSVRAHAGLEVRSPEAETTVAPHSATPAMQTTALPTPTAFQ